MVTYVCHPRNDEKGGRLRGPRPFPPLKCRATKSPSMCTLAVLGTGRSAQECPPY
jgi:hypothetical protein